MPRFLSQALQQPLLRKRVSKLQGGAHIDVRFCTVMLEIRLYILQNRGHPTGITVVFCVTLQVEVSGCCMWTSSPKPRMGGVHMPAVTLGEAIIHIPFHSKSFIACLRKAIFHHAPHEARMHCVEQLQIVYQPVAQ